MGSNYWFQFDTNLNVLYRYLQDNAPESSSTMQVLGPYPEDIASVTVVMAYNYPGRFTVQNGQLIEQPFFSLSVTLGTNQYIITAALNNPPAAPPANATFTVAGQTITEAITNNQAVLTMGIHPSVANQLVSVAVSATGCAGASVNVGGSGQSVQLQAYKDSNGNLHVAPTQKAVLQAYYASIIPPEVVPANTLVAVSLLLDFVFNTLATSAVISSLNPDAQNAYNDLKANVLGKLPLALANAYPSGGTKEVHYASFVQNMPVYAQASEDYISDLANIPNLQ